MQKQRSWMESANQPGTDFPLANLPWGVFSAGDSVPRIGVAIGDSILDMHAAADAGLLNVSAATLDTLRARSLNWFMALGPSEWNAVRACVTAILAEGSPDRAKAEPCMVAMSEATMHLPAEIGDYTDFYASVHHATNVGKLFRPDNPLLPNYKYVPIGYHSRSSSIVISGTDFARPVGQTKAPDAPAPSFGPCRMLDYELEVGLFAGAPNRLGAPVKIDEAESHIFGLCIVNDWSARDLQAWEYQPLGPFLAKNFATTISPWIVPMAALEPFRVPALVRPEGDPAPLPYLTSPSNETRGGVDITLELTLQSEKMRAAGIAPFVLGRTNTKYLYWTLAQFVTHHTSNGCNLRPGDLIASGTISGPEPTALGSIIEITRRGAEPLQLPSGEQRKFLEDGDEIVIRGWCEREGFARIGFGECRGRVLPAVEYE